MTRPLRKPPKPGDKALTFVLVPLMVLAMAAAGPLREWAMKANFGYGLFFDIAPSLFVGASLALFIAIMEKVSLTKCFLLALGVATGLEVLQGLLPRQTFDLWDIGASALGAALVLPLIDRMQRS